MCYAEKTGIIMPPSPDQYPGALVMAIACIRRAARFLDLAITHIPAEVPGRTKDALAEVLSTLWNHNDVCCDSNFEILYALGIPSESVADLLPGIGTEPESE